MDTNYLSSWAGVIFSKPKAGHQTSVKLVCFHQFFVTRNTNWKTNNFVTNTKSYRVGRQRAVLPWLLFFHPFKWVALRCLGQGLPISSLVGWGSTQHAHTKGLAHAENTLVYPHSRPIENMRERRTAVEWLLSKQPRQKHCLPESPTMVKTCLPMNLAPCTFLKLSTAVVKLNLLAINFQALITCSGPCRVSLTLPWRGVCFSLRSRAVYSACNFKLPPRRNWWQNPTAWWWQFPGETHRL